MHCIIGQENIDTPVILHSNNFQKGEKCPAIISLYSLREDRLCVTQSREIQTHHLIRQCRCLWAPNNGASRQASRPLTPKHQLEAEPPHSVPEISTRAERIVRYTGTDTTEGQRCPWALALISTVSTGHERETGPKRYSRQAAAGAQAPVAGPGQHPQQADSRTACGHRPPHRLRPGTGRRCCATQRQDGHPWARQA